MNWLTGPSARRWRAAPPGAALLLVVITGPLLAQTHAQLASEIDTLKKLSFEELLDTPVMLVSGREEKLSESPSAIQVVTAEDIRRSAASSLAEALRLAPNLQVAQVNAHDWAISARGFNNTLANKLLVMIDGRTIYTPLFAGVFWQEQNLMLEDIDRIEVVSGPGATLWGANAVNGVINIVTKSAKDTQGTLISGGGGSLLDEFGSIRYGDKIGENLFFRLYGMGFGRDATRRRDGSGATDDWFLGQGGFRADWLPAGGVNRTFTLKGNAYGGKLNGTSPTITDVKGQNLLGRWTQALSAGSDFSVQAYWDRTHRDVQNGYEDDLNTFDLMVQHSGAMGERQLLLWGGGYRLMADRIHNHNRAAFSFIPADRNLQLFSGFVQDEITLAPDTLRLTLGAKLEHNDFSGFEIQPSARMAWTISPNQVLWSAVSRAVRSPSRVDRDLSVPSLSVDGNRGTLVSNSDFDSEKLLAFELGYRVRPLDKLALSFAAYYNFYDDLRSIDQASATTLKVDNHFEGETWGLELAGDLQAADWWRLRGGYDYFHKHLSPTTPAAVPGVREGNDPHHIFKLQSIMDFRGFFKGRDSFQLDVAGRYYDALMTPNVPSYVSADVRLAWAWQDRLEIALVGQNLLDNQHPEFGALATRLEIPRSVYGKVTVRF
ncbi:MAG: TonB-dependent receptor [Verrucomicrobiales bacterium]|nr:TonB-dependent receptor [Verrucomicrobiales bacterium]